MSKVTTLGEQIDDLFELDERISAINTTLGVLKKEQEEKEIAVLKALGAQKLEQSRGSKGSITISRRPVPQAKDWDKIYGYINKHKMPYLLEKRVSSKVYNEIIATIRGGKIPGLETFEKVTLSYHSNPK